MSGETSPDWPHVVAVSSDGEYRIIVSNDTPPAMQWILQLRYGGKWRNRKFCQSKAGLKLFTGFDRSLAAVVETLPDWCPQVPHSVATASRPSEATQAPEIQSWASGHDQVALLEVSGAR